MHVLDLGGRPATWTQGVVHPGRVVCVNVESGNESGTEWCVCVSGDACKFSPELLDEHFDLVYSNSVIEHVGGMATACVRRVGTPGRRSPLN